MKNLFIILLSLFIFYNNVSSYYLSINCDCIVLEECDANKESNYGRQNCPVGQVCCFSG
jgi:hypothetical protein